MTRTSARRSRKRRAAAAAATRATFTTPFDELLATVALPDGKTMTLLRWWETAEQSHVAIRVDGRPLMSSHDRGSEEVLGELVGARLAGLAAPHVLIGGLGLGFTLRAALDSLTDDARVTVAELVPEVVAWNRGEHGALAGRPVDDPRVTVETADVALVIAANPGAFDAIVLDVDNGPDALVHAANAKLYRRAGLDRARGALRGPGSILAVWSAFPSKTFTKWLAETGFDVAVERAASADPRGPRYYIWVGIPDLTDPVWNPPRATSIERLLAALDAVPDPDRVSGALPLGTPIAIALPDGDTCTTANPEALVAWLVGPDGARSEPAPFGDGAVTRYDPAVRQTQRLVARGAARVTDFGLAAILGTIESVLATDRHVTAALLDVLVYGVGGKFAPHRDTPRTDDQLGTLVVELPVPHAGGALRVRGEPVERVAGGLPWTAMFGDAPHEVTEVTHGTRVTLVYTLRLAGGPRADVPASVELDAIADAMIAVIGDDFVHPGGGRLLVPCNRMAIVPALVRDEALPLPRDVLRGADRVIADTLARAGAIVRVRQCLVTTYADREDVEPFPRDKLGRRFTLARAIPDDAFENAILGVSFADEADFDETHPDGYEALIVGPAIEEVEPPIEDWLVRRAARARLVHDGLQSGTGYFGNEAHVANTYSLTALEIVLPPYADRVRG